MNSKKKENIVIFFLLCFSIYCAVSISESWDESWHLLQGKTTLEYLFSLGQINLNKDLYFSERYSPSYWTIQYLIVQMFTSKYQIEAAHLINLTMSLGTLIGLGKLTKELFNKNIGKITILILFFYPIFFGHMAFNGKDTVLVFSHVWITYLLLRYIKYQHHSLKTNNYIILIGLLASMGMGVQIAFLGSLIPIIFIFFFDIFVSKKITTKRFSTKRFFKDIIKCFAIFYFSLMLFWIDAHPNILILPFKFFMSTLAEDFWSGWHFNLVNGNYYFYDQVPKTYFLYNLIFKSPEYFLFLYLIFFIFLTKFRFFFKKSIKNFDYKLLIILSFLIYPNLILFVLPYNVYDGLRLFLWALPYYCIIPGLVIYFFIKNFNNIIEKILFFLITATSIYFLYNFLIFTPYQYTYLNLFTGKKEMRYKKFENDYWGASLKELVSNSDLSKKQTVLITTCGINKDIVKKYLKSNGYSKLNFVNPEKANYIIMTNRAVSKIPNPTSRSELTNCFDKYSGKNISQVKRNNQILSVIRKIN